MKCRSLDDKWCLLNAFEVVWLIFITYLSTIFEKKRFMVFIWNVCCYKFVVLWKSDCFCIHSQMQYANRFFLNYLIKWYDQITKFDKSSKEKCLSHKSRIMFTLNSHQAKSVLDIPSKFLIPSLAYKIKSHHALKNFEVSVENEWIFLKNM